MVKEDVLSRLRGLGLSGYAAKAFLTILGNQPISAGNLCKLTGIPDSKIYYALRELEERGLIVVQRGTPSLYRTLSVSKMLTSLESQVDEEHRRRLDAVRSLQRLLEPLAGRGAGEEFELAYIIKGFRNILEKMKDAIGEARREVLLMTTSKRLLEGLKDVLKEARRRDVDMKVAISEELLESDVVKEVRPARTISCDCNILIVDSTKLVTSDNIDSEDCYALVTQDQGMIAMSGEYYENPKCCIMI